MIQPMEEGTEGEKTLVEGSRYIGVGEGGFGCDVAKQPSVGHVRIMLVRWGWCTLVRVVKHLLVISLPVHLT